MTFSHFNGSSRHECICTSVQHSIWSLKHAQSHYMHNYLLWLFISKNLCETPVTFYSTGKGVSLDQARTRLWWWTLHSTSWSLLPSQTPQSGSNSSCMCHLISKNLQWMSSYKKESHLGTFELATHNQQYQQAAMRTYVQQLSASNHFRWTWV